MVEDVKKAVNPILGLMKELNSQVKSGDIDVDTLVKLSTTMKVSSMQLDKIVKNNKDKITGGYVAPQNVEEES